MNRYLLRRDNKENGPYSLEEITAKGFKAYDLIWIEGRSAGWRYPGEIAELKPFAPVVEEQPYDRFYKKPTQQPEPAKEETIVEVKTPVRTIIEEPNFQATVKIPMVATKKIYVTLPGEGRTPIFIETEKQKPVEQKIIKEQSSESFNKPEPVALEEKYSQPLDEIKKMYVNKVLQEKKKSTSKIVINEKVKLAALAFALLLSGTAVGLFINRNKPSSEKIIAANIPEQKVINTAAQSKEPAVDNRQEATGNSQKEINISSREEKAVISLPPHSKNKEDDASSKEKIIYTKQEIPQKIKEPLSPPVTNNNSTTGETITNKQPRPTESSGRAQTNNKELESIKKNIGKEINITASNYKKATFGGISNLEFTVSNNTAYTIDMVIAEVDYYTANKKIYKTETVYFKNIAPNGSQVQQAPNSNRGYEVKYRISLISSKELGIYTAVL